MDDDAAIEAPRPEERRVEHVRAVRRGQDDDRLARVEAVHLGQQLGQRLLRSSLPPTRLPVPRRRPIASSSSRKMIAGAAAFAWANRSRTRAAPTPMIISMNSEPDIEKKGTWASFLG